MSQGEYAQHVAAVTGAKISQQAISKAVRSGKIPVAAGGKIDQESADRLWLSQRGAPASLVLAPAAPARESVAPAAGPGSAVPPAEPEQPKLGFAAPTPGTAAGEQALLARSRRERIEFDMEVARGEWVRAEEVAEAWGQRIVSARTRLLAVSHEFKDPSVRAQVERAIRDALGDVERQWMPAQENAAA